MLRAVGSRGGRTITSRRSDHLVTEREGGETLAERRDGVDESRGLRRSARVGNEVEQVFQVIEGFLTEDDLVFDHSERGCLPASRARTYCTVTVSDGSAASAALAGAHHFVAHPGFEHLVSRKQSTESITDDLAFARAVTGGHFLMQLIGHLVGERDAELAGRSHENIGFGRTDSYRLQAHIERV